MPLRARVDMTLAPTTDDTSATIEFDVELHDVGRVIWLNAIDLHVTAATLELNGVTTPLTIVPGTTDSVGFEAPRAIPNGTGKLHVAYTGTVSPKEHTGLFREQVGGNWYAFTKFESTDARRALPCFDEPSFKFPWQLTLHVPASDTAVSNTPIVSETPAAGGSKTVVFAETKPLPSYLFAFAVGPFEMVEAKGASIPMRIVVAKGHAAQARVAAENSPALVNLLEKYFGMPFPYPKLDMVVIPDYPGAMENAGMITYGQQTILHDDWTPSDMRRFANIVAHESAHQWFGDLVTTAWWDDIWLNEAFATWMAAKIVDQWKPAWRGDLEAVGERIRAMQSDAQITARKIRQPIHAKTDIQAAFDGITYQKGAAILRMFETAIGPDLFQKGVHAYLEKHAWKTTTVTDFVTAIGEAAGKDVATPFATFLDQAGLPLVTVELTCTKGAPPTVELSQDRYLPMGSPAAPARWQLPICMRWPGGRQCTTLVDAKASVSLDTKTCPAWLEPNDKAIGYYRVLAKGDLSAKLMATPASAVSAAERVAIVDDALAMAKSDKLPIAEALKLVTVEARSADPRLVIDAAEWLDRVDDAVPEDLRPQYAKLLVRLFGTRARQLGWQPGKADDDDTRDLRPSVLWTVGAVAGDAAVVADAKRVAGNYLHQPASVSKDVANQALAIAARFGDLDLLQKLIAAVSMTQDRDERDRLVYALGSFRDPHLHDNVMQIALSDVLPPERALRLLYIGMSQVQTRASSFAFVEEHYDKLAGKLPRNAMIYLPYLGASFCDDQHRTEVETFFKPKVANIMGASHILDEVLEQIRACTASRAAQAASLRAFLTKS